MLWSTLRQQSASRWVRSSYFWLFFVPIAAQVLSSVPGKVTFEFIGRHVQFTVGLPFSWKLFYFGSVCFSLAAFIYYLACPPLVRDFSTFSEYDDIGKGPAYLVDQFFSMMFAEARKGPSRSTKQTVSEFKNQFTQGHIWAKKSSLSTFYWDLKDFLETDRPGVILIGTKPDKLSITLLPDVTKLPNGFWFARNTADYSRTTYRWICTVLYVFGYVSFFLVAYQGAVYVLRAL